MRYLNKAEAAVTLQRRLERPYVPWSGRASRACVTSHASMVDVLNCPKRNSDNTIVEGVIHVAGLHEQTVIVRRAVASSDQGGGGFLMQRPNLRKLAMKYKPEGKRSLASRGEKVELFSAYAALHMRKTPPSQATGYHTWESFDRCLCFIMTFR